MFSKINSLGIHGVEGFPVTVEADVSDGLPGFIMVGYLSEAVKEAQDRVRMALKNSGFYLPPKKVVVCHPVISERRGLPMIWRLRLRCSAVSAKCRRKGLSRRL